MWLRHRRCTARGASEMHHSPVGGCRLASFPAGVPRRPTPAPTIGRVDRSGISTFLPSIGSRRGVSLTGRRPCGRGAFGGMWTPEGREPMYAAAASKQFALREP